MKHIKRFSISLLATVVAMLLLSGPAATHLQSRDHWADPAADWDAVYLVCGARAQDRRITALLTWLGSKTESRKQKAEIEARAQSQAGNSNISAFSFQLSAFPILLIGNDPQKSLWCRKHQTNHTRTEWAEEKLKAEIGKLKSRGDPNAQSQAGNSNISAFSFQLSAFPLVVPGDFRNTDGEMMALATFLEAHPEIESIALATSRFHSRRLLQRFRARVGTGHTVGIVPGVSWWENRAPWIVLGEYLKMLRDRLGLSGILTRAKKSEGPREGSA